MQTFLPYPDFERSAACLDNRRLGKQRVECMQILNALNGVQKGWRNHPAVKMWAGHELALESYMAACIVEWRKRGFKNTMVAANFPSATMPSWFGNENFHAAHRSNLLRKDPAWYGQFGWTEPDNLDYVWP